jgi:hypothetical protein
MYCPLYPEKIKSFPIVRIEEPTIDQQYRQLNALVRTQAQRDKIKDALKTSNRQGLDARHDGFKLQGNKVMYQLPNGDAIQLLMSSEDVENQLRTVTRRKSGQRPEQSTLLEMT